MQRNKVVDIGCKWVWCGEREPADSKDIDTLFAEAHYLQAKARLAFNLLDIQLGYMQIIMDSTHNTIRQVRTDSYLAMRDMYLAQRDMYDTLADLLELEFLHASSR